MVIYIWIKSKSVLFFFFFPLLLWHLAFTLWFINEGALVVQPHARVSPDLKKKKKSKVKKIGTEQNKAELFTLSPTVSLVCPLLFFLIISRTTLLMDNDSCFSCSLNRSKGISTNQDKITIKDRKFYSCTLFCSRCPLLNFQNIIRCPFFTIWRSK